MTQPGADGRRPRVALFQPVLAHYRVDLFNEFDRVIGRGLTIFTSLPTSAGLGGAIERSRITRRRARTWQLGPLWFVPATVPAVWRRRWDVVVLSWNVRQIELLPVLMLARIRGVPVILWGHGLGANRSGATLMLRRMQARLAAAVLTYDEAGRQEVLALAPDQDIRVLLNTTGRGAPDREQVLANARGKITYLGRLDGRKQVGRLLQAMAQVSEEGLDLHLDVVGDGAERSGLALQAERLGLTGRISWHGHLPDWSATRAILAQTDLVVLPSAAGLAVVDAFAAARAVVVLDDTAGNGPEAELVVDGESGFRYGPATAAALAERLVQIYADPDCLVHASRAAAACYRERLTLDRAGVDFESLVEALTAGARSGQERG